MVHCLLLCSLQVHLGHPELSFLVCEIFFQCSHFLLEIFDICPEMYNNGIFVFDLQTTKELVMYYYNYITKLSFQD